MDDITHVDLVSEHTLDPMVLREEQKTTPVTAEDDGEEDDPEEIARKKKIVDRAHRRFRIAENFWGPQRKREVEDLKFDRALPEDQWPDAWAKSRKGGVGPDGAVIPERPMVTIPKLGQPVQQTLSEARGARLAIIIKAKGDSTKEEADLYQGLIRTIEVESRASIARMWALDRASKCGIGWYEIVKRQVIVADPVNDPAAFDMELGADRVLNQHSIYADPMARQPDWSDGMWLLETRDLTGDEHDDRFPDAKITKMSDTQLSMIGDKLPGWVSGGEDQDKTFRVGRYFYVEKETRTLVHFTDHGAKWKDELDEGLYEYAKSEGHIANERDIPTRKVKYCWINATEVLEEHDWEGQWIPFVPVLGLEFNVEGDRCFKGIISNAKDAQRSYNVMRSAQIESIGLASKAPWIMVEGQDEGYTDMWDNANTRGYTRLYYRTKDLEGNTVPGPPQRQTAEPAIQAIGVAVQEADADIRATTGRANPGLERPRMRVRSGKALQNLNAEGEQTTSIYLDNLATVSMYHEARIYIDLIPKVMDRPGRIEKILGEEDKERRVMLNAPFVETPEGPKPAPVQPQAAPAPPQPGMMSRVAGAMGSMVGRQAPTALNLSGQQQPAPKVHHYDLSKPAQFTITISVGKKSDTKRDQNIQAMSAIYQAAPQTVAPTVDLFVAQMDFPGSKQMAERLKKMNPAAKDDPADGSAAPIPPELQAKMAAMGEQNQKLQQAVRQMGDQLKTDAVQGQRDLLIKRMELASKERIELLKIKRDLLLAELDVKSEHALAMIDAQLTTLTEHMDDLQERHLQALTHAHEGMLALAEPPAQEAPAA